MSVSRATAIWLCLVWATALSILTSDFLPPNAVLVTTAVMLIAAIKVLMIGLEFMELRVAPPLARIAFLIWVGCLFSGMIGLYLVAQG